MGQAKQRGTFEERKAKAEPKPKRLSADERREVIDEAARNIQDKLHRAIENNEVTGWLAHNTQRISNGIPIVGKHK